MAYRFTSAGYTFTPRLRTVPIQEEILMSAPERSRTCPIGHYAWASGDHPPMTGFRQFDREDRDPVFFTTDAAGYHVFTEQEAIAEGMQRTDLFSSHAIEPITPNPEYRWIPEMLDPPEHTQWRRV